MKNTLFLLLVLVSFSIVSAESDDSERLDKDRLSLKSFAVCECLARTHPELDSIWIADGSISSYFQGTRYPLYVYGTMMNRAEQAARKTYSSKYNEPLHMMKCLDFYNSSELDSLVRLFDTAWMGPTKLEMLHRAKDSAGTTN